MKLFKCIIKTNRNFSDWYFETLLIVAESIEDAEKQIKDSKRDKYNKDPYIEYTQPLEELKIDLSKRGILLIGFGKW
jgi:hypothetical protein